MRDRCSAAFNSPSRVSTQSSHGAFVCALVGGLLACLAACDGARGTAAQEDRADEPAARERRTPNRLIRESSPYLLLHAHNPVDWYPWGSEAFERAKREGKPVFLSIGYSSCYWCHVMERLVFENAEIAAYMNEHFVNVKVDREERPDVDEIYMTALQVYFQAIGSRQGGGWPLSMFLTPDGKPIAGGTYFPPETKDGRVGFPDVMRKMVEVWSQHREGVEGNAELISREVRRAMLPPLNLTPAKLEPALVASAVRAVAGSHDPEYGGVGFDPARPHAPKFPTPSKLALLEWAAVRDDDEAAGKVVLHTLDAIAAGGIRDHLGGGFHRYSTDREWLVPHFEKMLYDQAQLVDLYVAAFERTGERRYREVAEETLGFVLREMTGAEGGFFSALDAETDGIEGKFYVWSRAEVESVLGPGDAPLFLRAYGMTGPSRFEHGDMLHLPEPLDGLAAELRMDAGELRTSLAAMRAKLLDARTQRKPLLRDDKVLASWNGLMIHAFARAGAALERPDYTAAAARAATFVLSHMRDDRKRLQRTWREGRSSLNAYLDDYAFLVRGLLALHDATQDEKWLNAARRLTDQQIELFWDETGKAFFFTSH
ncbi:MAG TPA: thioredoxin domain-containing protein, partial [Planctomycetaceae bacterium]|nr:thioredoxin domain-containing protein [Planctomycetaceae bacterium]